MVVFNPGTAGTYTIKIEENSSVIAYYSFEVVEKEPDLFYLDKDSYYAGEIVTISPNVNLANIRILFENRLFEYSNVTQKIAFIPNETGTYIVTAEFQNNTLSKTFNVIEKEEPREEYGSDFDLNEDVIIDFDLGPIVDDRKTILNILFGTTPMYWAMAKMKGLTLL